MRREYTRAPARRTTGPRDLARRRWTLEVERGFSVAGDTAGCPLPWRRRRSARMQVEPFRIAVPDAVLTDLRQRLARTRFPAEIPDSGWTYGTNLAYLRELVAHWYERYDWRAEEAKLNAFPQVKARVGDLGIHAIHARGVGP